MPVLGGVTYSPGPKFALNRSYVYQFVLGFGANAIIVRTDNQFFVTDGNNPNVHVICDLKPRVWNWNSDAFTLDFVLLNWYLLVDPDPNPRPLAKQIIWQQQPPSLIKELWIRIAGWTTRYVFLMPSQPSDYWKPAPPFGI